MKAEPDAEQRPPALKERVRPPAYTYDPMLAIFLDLAEQDVVRFDITLLVDGHYVSGTPISRQAFVDGLGRLFRENSRKPGAMNEALGDFFAQIAGGLDERVYDPQTSVVEHVRAMLAEPVADSIQLRDAVITVNGTLASIPLWRGRLTAVSAWFPGKMGQGG